MWTMWLVSAHLYNVFVIGALPLCIRNLSLLAKHLSFFVEKSSTFFEKINFQSRPKGRARALGPEWAGVYPVGTWGEARCEGAHHLGCGGLGPGFGTLKKLIEFNVHACFEERRRTLQKDGDFLKKDGRHWLLGVRYDLSYFTVVVYLGAFRSL